MEPPGFVPSTLDRKGMNQRCCRECLRSAAARYSLKVVCLRYFREVGLYSVCDSFLRRVGADPPVVDWEEDDVRSEEAATIEDSGRGPERARPSAGGGRGP